MIPRMRPESLCLKRVVVELLSGCTLTTDPSNRPVKISPCSLTAMSSGYRRCVSLEMRVAFWKSLGLMCCRKVLSRG